MAHWYIDNSVSSSGDGTSWATAWKDFGNVVWSSVAGGDTVYISGGSTSQTYSSINMEIRQSGTAGNPITITAGVDSGHNGTVIMDGATSTLINSSTAILDTFGSTNLVISNLTLQNTLENCLFINSTASGTVLAENLTIHTGTGYLSATTNAATTAGSNVLHFASISDRLVNCAVIDATHAVVPTGTPPGLTPTTVSSLTANTVTLSANVTGAGVASGDTINFALNARGIRIAGSTGGTITVQNCVVDTPANSISQTDTLYTGGNSGAAIIIQDNTFTVNNTDASGHSDCFQSFEDQGITFRRNLCTHPNGGSNNHGVIVSDVVAGGTVSVYDNIISMGYSPSSNAWPEAAIFRENLVSGYTGTVNVWNNTIYGGFAGLYIYTGLTLPSGDSYKNNIFYAKPEATFAYYFQNTSPTASGVDYNCVYADNAGSLRLQNATGTLGMARSTTSQSSGKYYFEVQLGWQYNSGNNLIGLANSSETLTNYVGATNNSVGYLPQDGRIYVGGSFTTYISAVAGDMLAFAVDLTNKLFWVKDLTSASNWNNSGTANPATGTGGVSFSAVTGPFYLAQSLNPEGDYSILNAGASAFLGTVPSGFSAWGSSAVWNASDMSTNLSLTPLIAYNNGTYETWSAWQTTGFDAHGINSNPNFVGASTGNFQLQAGSPCVDAGVTIATVAVDYANVSRPQGPAYDIGAYERIPSSRLARSIGCRFEVDWSKPLAQNLATAVLFNGTYQDLATPARTWTPTAMAFVPGALGVAVHATTVNGGLTSSSNTPNSGSGSWTLSVMSLFPITATAGTLARYDGGHYHALVNPNTTSGDLACYASGYNYYSPNISTGNLTGWHRLTITNDGATMTAYVDGGINGKGTITGAAPGALELAFSIAVGSTGSDAQWGDTADLFIWERALTAGEVTAHYANPYGTTLRPVRKTV